MAKSILIVGLGLLGRNYIKAISDLQFKVNVYYYDKKKKEREKKITNTQKVNFIKINNIKSFKKKIDLTIISTTAYGRLKLIENLIKTKSKFWIIEKIIEQNSNSIDKIKEALKPYKCWIDMPRRGMKEYNIIKKIMKKKKLNNSTLKVTMNGDRIVTSSVHMIDLMCWLFNTSINKIELNSLNTYWVESKRKGFFDIGGKLVIKLKNDSKIILKTSDRPVSGDIIIGNSKFYININETRGNILMSNGKKLNIEPPHVSIIMKKIITSILLKGKSNLPLLEDAIVDHNVLIDNLKLHWQKVHAKKIKNLPVT
tara:strand:- start:113 stop:1048 length:936 start_codon:yes stop_codon:yes gene_type:complete